jgi:hypothetical protein
LLLSDEGTGTDSPNPDLQFRIMEPANLIFELVRPISEVAAQHFQIIPSEPALLPFIIPGPTGL